MKTMTCTMNHNENSRWIMLTHKNTKTKTQNKSSHFVVAQYHQTNYAWLIKRSVPR